jgi:endo-1,4-beta-xylanase
MAVASSCSPSIRAAYSGELGRGCANGAHPVFGAAVRSDALRNDAAYRQAVIKFCQIVVPEGELKWATVQPKRGQFSFSDADLIVQFAKSNGLSVRGHTLAWYAALPSWTADIDSRAEAEVELVGHIRQTVTRYAGVIPSWDVVNEPMPDRPTSVRDLRESLWTKQIGPDYIPLAFKTAHACDPSARLFINEYDIEYDDARSQAKRDAFLALLLRLKDDNVPVHGVGVQAHLVGSRTIDRRRLGDFLRAVHDLGLETMITELDVIDNEFPGDEALRDKLIAQKTRELLDCVFDAVQPTGILTWGLSDKYTWVPIYYKRHDGLPNRPLPLDRDMQTKPMYAVLSEFITRCGA